MTSYDAWRAGRWSTDGWYGVSEMETWAKAPRPHVLRAATDRRCCWRGWDTQRRQRTRCERMRPMTAADRFAEQLRRRVEALDKWPGPDLNWAFIPFSGAVERDKLLAALLRQPERGAP